MHGPLSAAYAKPDDLRTLTAVIYRSAQRRVGDCFASDQPWGLSRFTERSPSTAAPKRSRPFGNEPLGLPVGYRFGCPRPQPVTRPRPRPCSALLARIVFRADRAQALARC